MSMRELQLRYGVDDIFFDRYFVRNAENRFVNALKRFMLWHEGHFPDPRKKLEHVRAHLADELADYYERGLFVIPQIGFSLTTRCTLRCQHCIALSPLFEQPAGARFTHEMLSFEDYKAQLDELLAGVDGVRRLFLHGGEPLLNPDLAKIVDYSAAQDKITLVELITNGTLACSPELLDALERHKHKVYLAINNYSVNPALEGRLRYKEVIAALEARGIKHPLYSELSWFRQEPLRDRGMNTAEVRAALAGCWCRHSLQILGGVLAICPRASIGHRLGIVPTPDEDLIFLDGSVPDMRARLKDYYARDSFVACGYCAPQTDVIPPAGQMRAARDTAPYSVPDTAEDASCALSS